MTRGVAGTARCGTPSGWSKHKNADETPCDACARAKQEYDHRWRLADENTIRNRLSARSQAEAFTELRRRHKAEYDELYAEAKQRRFAEAGLTYHGVRSW